jgi:sugar phosphate isomerase/epimerase
VDMLDNTKAKDVLPGKGVCKLDEVFKILKQQKFNGLLSIEYEENPENNMQEISTYKNYIEAAIKK